MKFLKTDIEKPVAVRLDKSFKSDTSSGIMIYGSDNAYPQILERLILKSQTGSAAYRVLSSFIEGSGFQNTEIGRIVVGRDIRGKEITLNKIRSKIAKSLAMFHGVYIHANFNMNGEVGNTTVLPFKDYRFSTKDDRGYCSKIAHHNNWEKDADNGNFNKKDITWFNTFNQNTVISQIEDNGADSYKGQIFHEFIDDTYLYPLSCFDSVANDLDTEYQIQLFKNREIRNGFTDKIIMTIAESEDENYLEDKIDEIKKSMGADGSKFILFQSKFDEQGNLQKDGSFQLDTISTNINDKLFENWETRISNSIRKAAYNMPAILIDYQQGTLSATSGDAISEAFDVYNSYTLTLRSKLSEILEDLYSNSNNEVLRNNSDWEILPL